MYFLLFLHGVIVYTIMLMYVPTFRINFPAFDHETALYKSSILSAFFIAACLWPVWLMLMGVASMPLYVLMAERRHLLE